MAQEPFFAGRRGALLTKHKKEEVIKPVLEKGIGCQLIVDTDYDTDQLGTFTREIARLGSQLEAARHKARKAIDLKETDLGFASEGSFGSYPGIPYLPVDREIVLLIDAREDLEICGECLNSKTNFASMLIENLEQAEEFARRALFPSHFLVIRPDHDEHPDILKGINDWEWLREAVSRALAKSSAGKAFLETDMRAHANPTRMQNIKKAAEDLVAKINQCCPQCRTPGFMAVESKKGLPCECCGLPTKEVASLIFACQKCCCREERAVAVRLAPAARCDYCNP